MLIAIMYLLNILFTYLTLELVSTSTLIIIINLSFCPFYNIERVSSVCKSSGRDGCFLQNVSGEFNVPPVPAV